MGSNARYRLVSEADGHPPKRNIAGIPVFLLYPPGSNSALECLMNSELQSDIRHSQSSWRNDLHLLRPGLIFGTAWFWTLPEVYDVQVGIDVLRKQFRRYVGMKDTGS